MANRIKQAVAYGFAVALGIVIGGIGVWKLSAKPAAASQWFVLNPRNDKTSGEWAADKKPDKERIPVLASDEVILGDKDIGPPDVTGLKGKAKFLDTNPDPASGDLPLGYIIEVTMKPTDLTKVPDKYKHDKDLGNGVTLPALVDARYQVNFDFVLLDKDGFELLKLESPETALMAGGTRVIQDHTKATVPRAIASKVASVQYELTIIKNNTLGNYD